MFVISGVGYGTSWMTRSLHFVSRTRLGGCCDYRCVLLDVVLCSRRFRISNLYPALFWRKRRNIPHGCRAVMVGRLHSQSPLQNMRRCKCWLGNWIPRS